MNRAFIYTRFERFWHWSQALLIVLLAVTGMDIHFAGLNLLQFEDVVRIHELLAWSLIVLTVFAVFWHFTTGEWRQYLPTRKYLVAMIRYYALDIFRSAPHPVHKARSSKLNPLQRIAYLGYKLMIMPLVLVTGFVYLYFNDLVAAGLLRGGVGTVATLHILGAFLLLAFLVGHVYLSTTGRTWSSNIEAMITGWEELEES